MSQVSYYYNVTYSHIRTYNYFIWTNDTSGNSNVSYLYHFEIVGFHRISLNENWNLIAIPFNESIVKTDITVTYNETDYNWWDAVNEGIIVGFIYGWDEIVQGYEFVDVLHPGKGYWMYAYFNCNLEPGNYAFVAETPIGRYKAFTVK